MIRYFRFVPFHKIESFLSLGWIMEGDLGHPHGNYSVLMRACECEQQRLESAL